MPDDLEPLLQEHGIAQTVLVQATDAVAETGFLLDLATQHDWIAGVVGWVDIQDPNSVAQLEAWSRHPKFKGIRPMLQDIEDPSWIAHAPHDNVVNALIRLGLRFDALVQPKHLQALLAFVHKWPALAVVIDHGAKPSMMDGWSTPWAQTWRSGMQALAEHPQIFCKVSGLLTETGLSAQAPEHFERCAAMALGSMRFCPLKF